MKAQLNRHLFTQSSVDSGALSTLSAVIHSFREAGEYQITLLWRNETVRRFPLIVDDRYDNMQTDIDLAAMQRQQPREGQFVLKPGGHAVFHVSHGAGGYAVIATQQGERKPSDTTPGHGNRPTRQTPAPLPFDSRELREGDMFAVTLLRPGIYSLTNGANRARGDIILAYPRPRSRYAALPEPVSIEVTDKGFDPSHVEVQALQGLIFRIHTPSRIRLDLTKPDDGPEGERPPRLVTWRKPSVAQGREKTSK